MPFFWLSLRMYSSSFLSSLVRSSPKNRRNSARFSWGVRGSSGGIWLIALRYLTKSSPRFCAR